MIADTTEAIEAVLNGRLRDGPRHRTLGPFRVTDCGPDELALAVKCAHQRRAPQPIDEALRVFEALGREAWVRDEHLRWIACNAARPVKLVRAEFEAARRWLCDVTAWFERFGSLDSAGQLIQRGQHTAWTRGLPAVLVQAGQLAAYKSTAVAHAILAGGHNVIVKTTSHEPLSAFLFARACLERGLSVPQVVHVDARREDNREALRRAIARSKHSVVFGEDKTIQGLFRELPWDADHRVAPFWTGRSGAVVMDDADVDLAAACLVRGMVSLGRGDDCASTKRVVVHAAVADALAAALVREVEGLRAGAPDDDATDWCPDEAARDATLRYFEGAEVFYDGGAVMGFCAPNAAVFGEELPYPMLALQRFRASDDPAAMADRHVAHTPSGRAVSTAVFTRREETFRAVASRLSTDKALWNKPSSAYDFAAQHSGHHLCFAMMRPKELVL